MTLENPSFRLTVERKGVVLTHYPATVDLYGDGDMWMDEFIGSLFRCRKFRTPWFYRWTYDGEPKWTLRLPFGWDITWGRWGEWRCADD